MVSIYDLGRKLFGSEYDEIQWPILERTIVAKVWDLTNGFKRPGTFTQDEIECVRRCRLDILKTDHSLANRTPSRWDEKPRINGRPPESFGPSLLLKSRRK